MPTEARDQLLDAASRVCETSFFAYTEPASPDVIELVAAESSWYHAEVTFTGPLNGRVRLSLPEDLAREMFAAFLGCADSSAANSAEIQDVVGECSNMVCGAWLTMLGGDTCFALAHPSVVPGGLPEPQDDSIIMSVNDRPAVIRAELE